MIHQDLTLLANFSCDQ